MRGNRDDLQYTPVRTVEVKDPRSNSSIGMVWLSFPATTVSVFEAAARIHRYVYGKMLKDQLLPLGDYFYEMAGAGSAS